MKPLVSICIPSYKQPELFERCLKSIVSQEYKNIEVIVSDDTPDDTVKIIADRYKSLLTLQYYHNTPSLNSPANWNFSLDKANGEYVMLLHHDDWLATSLSITTYIKTFEANKEIDVIYSKAVSVFEDNRQTYLTHIPSALHKIYKHPENLIVANLIGPPSLLMLKGIIKTRYNLRYKWLVDIEYYIQLLLNKHKFLFIDQHLVSIGRHAEQTTEYCLSDSEILLKENLSILKQYERLTVGNISIYDYYWRLLRNHKIRNLEQLHAMGIKLTDIPSTIVAINNFQKRLPLSLLNFGVTSKLFMSISFIKTKNT